MYLFIYNINLDFLFSTKTMINIMGLNGANKFTQYSIGYIGTRGGGQSNKWNHGKII